jgi:hypothetical protein
MRSPCLHQIATSSGDVLIRAVAGCVLPKLDTAGEIAAPGVTSRTAHAFAASAVIRGVPWQDRFVSSCPIKVSVALGLAPETFGAPRPSGEHGAFCAFAPAKGPTDGMPPTPARRFQKSPPTPRSSFVAHRFRSISWARPHQRLKGDAMTGDHRRQQDAQPAPNQ